MLIEKNFHMKPDGFYCEDEFVSCFRLRAVKKCFWCEFDKTAKHKEFMIQAELSDGTVTDPVIVKDYKKMDFSSYWDQCIDAGLSVRCRNLLIEDLQCQLNKLTWQEEIRLKHRGLYRMDPVLYVYSAGEIIQDEKDMKQYVTTEDIPSFVIKQVPAEVVQDYIYEWCSFLPGVTDVLFLYRGLSILKPIFVRCGIKMDMLLGLIGPSGSLKTTFAEMMISPDAVLKFMTAKYKDIEKQLSRYQGGCIILDDYKKANQPHVKKRMQDNFEFIARTADYPDTAMVITTGEFIEGYFSMQDRMIHVYVDKKKKAFSQNEMLKLHDLQMKKYIMDYFWYDFTKKIYLNSQKVIDLFQEDISMIQQTKSGYRIDRNICILKVVMSTFYSLYSNNKMLRLKSQMTQTLDYLHMRQSQHMDHIQIVSEETDWAELVYEAYDKRFFPEKVPYLTSKQTFFKDETLYITPLALRNGINSFLHGDYDISDIVEDLDKKQLLKCDNSKDKTVKRLSGTRYYAFNLLAMHIYVDEKKKRTNNVFSVIRRTKKE